MKRAVLSLAILALAAAPAGAQPPAKAPDMAPLIEQVCLPLLKGGTVAAAAANARPLAFTESARNATMVTLERDETFAMTVGPAYCFISLSPATPVHFRTAESELRAWLPRLGRYWAGPVESDTVMGVRYRKYRAGGFTVTIEEQIDEYGRRLNVTLGK